MDSITTERTKTIRLTKNSNKPVNQNNKTFQETLTEEDIEKQLEDYVEVETDEICKIPINSHLRYFTLKQMPNGTFKKLFRMGGFLSNKDNCSEYVILANGKLSWSVQTKSTIFYRKMKLSEIKEEYEELITEKNEEIEKYKKVIEKLKNNNNNENEEELKNENKKYKKEIRRLRDILKENNIDYTI